MADAKLKPCPFCGGKANRKIREDTKIPGAYLCAAYCVTGCRASISFTYIPPKWIGDPAKAAKTVIAKAWNRRFLNC